MALLCVFLRVAFCASCLALRCDMACFVYVLRFALCLVLCVLRPVLCVAPRIVLWCVLFLLCLVLCCDVSRFALRYLVRPCFVVLCRCSALLSVFCHVRCRVVLGASRCVVVGRGLVG